MTAGTLAAWSAKLAGACSSLTSVLLPLGPALEGGSQELNEFEGVQLGDKRRTARLVRSDAAAVDGYYRLIGQPAE